MGDIGDIGRVINIVRKMSDFSEGSNLSVLGRGSHTPTNVFFFFFPFFSDSSIEGSN